MHVLFKFIRLTLSISLLWWVSFIAIAQQEEKSSEEQKTSETKVKSKAKPEKKSNVISIPSPMPFTQQYNNDLKHYLPANKITPLLAGPNDYIMLITENLSVNNKGVVILLPDWQQGATSPKAINFLRENLPLQGWTTMSIQPATMPENYPSNAIETSKKQQENKIIIDEYKIKLSTMMNALMTKANEYPGIVLVIAQGNNGAMLIELLDQGNNPSAIVQSPNALVLLSGYLLTNNELIDEANMTFAKKLAYSEYPVLDLHLRHDNPIVLDKAKQRLSFSKQEMKVYYRQRQLNNTAMGYYPNLELLTQINSWLKSIGW